MDYEFFDSLTSDEARAFLAEFRASQERVLEEIGPHAARAGVPMNFSLSSLPDVLKWMVNRVRVHRVPVPRDEPWWIKQAHAGGLTEFDDDSKPMVLLAAYYLGECFARLTGLCWSTGDEEFLHKHMPVIKGFAVDKELPPLVVVSNMFLRILGDNGPESRINETIETWKGFLPRTADQP